MVNLYAQLAQQRQFGGYVTNQVRTAGQTQADPLTQTQAYRVGYGIGSAESRAKAKEDDHWAVGLTKTLVAAPVDIADTLASLVPGVERGDINDSVYEGLGMPGYAQWVRDHHGGVEIASGIIGAVATGWAAEVAAAKLVGSAWFAATGAARVAPALVNPVAKAQQAAAMASLEAAKSGQALGWFQGANRTYMLTKTGVGLAKAGVSEAAVVAALHNNSMIWSDDMGQNIMMMGLGLGIGGGVAAIGGRAALSKWANGQVIREAMTEAADPGQFARMLQDAPQGFAAARDLATLRGPVKTAEFTSLMLSATRNEAENAARLNGTVAPTRNAIQTGEQREALKLAQQFTSKGIRSFPETKFPIAGSGAGIHLQEAARQDPTILLGATEVGVMAAGMTPKKFVAERAARIQAILDQPFSKANEKRLARLQKDETPLFIVGKRLMGQDDAEYLAGYTPVDPSQFKPTTRGIKEFSWKAPSSTKRIAMREDGGITVDWDQTNLHDKLSIVDAAKHMLKQIGANFKITIPDNATWFQLDFALAHAERGGIVDFTTKFKALDLDEVKVRSLRIKAEKAAGLRVAGKPLDLQARLGLNLPLPSHMEQALDPNGDAFFSTIKQAMSPNTTIDQIKAAYVALPRVTDIGNNATFAMRMDGDIFNFNRIDHGSKKGEWAPMLAATYEDPSKITWSRFNLGEHVMEQKALTLRGLMTDKSAPFSAGVIKAVVENPGYKPVSDMMGLADNQVGGTTSSVGAMASQMLTQAMRFRHNVTLLAGQQIRRVVNRMTEIHLDSVLKRVSPHTEALTSVSGQRSRILLNNYATFSPGWDIEKAIPGATSDTFVFKLAKTDTNAARLGREVVDDDTLRTPQGVEVALDGLGNNTREALEKELKLLLAERNAGRIARGLEPVKFKPFYVPPPSTRGKILGFTLDASNRVVPGGTVIAATRDEFNRLAGKVKDSLTPGTRFVAQDEVADFVDLWEQAQMDWVNPLDFIDPQSLAARPGAQQGKLASAYVNPRGYEEILEYLKHGYEQVATGVIKAAFDGQFRLARIRSGAQQVVEGQAFATRNIFDTYTDTLLGISGSANPRGLNVVTSQLDKLIDSMMPKVWGPMQVSGQHVKDLIQKVAPKKLKANYTFEELADELGDYMPFKQATDFAEYQYGIKAPWTSKETARAVNRIGSGVVLRWLEMPHAVMNMAGLITNLPVVMTAKNVPMVGRVGKVGVVDSTKIMSRGFKRQFERNTADWDMMVRNGDTTQDVAELHHQLSLLDGKTKFMKFMTGNPNGKTFLERKGLEGMASIMTDTTENMSRRWAHFVGLELADLHGIVGMEARHNFARSIANDAIANYDPLNRPEIFQSAFGSMYGLFLSYAQNYYQRLFRYVEDADYKAVGKQMAIQASMFGMTGVPGFRQLATLIGGEEDGDDLVSGIYQRFGPVVGSVVAQGGFNQWTTLFGLPAVALHTRGDANFRHPAIDFATGVPALPVGLEVIKDVSQGMWESVTSLVNPNVPGSQRYAAEVLARHMPSRMLRGAITVLANGGQEADAYGNLMSENKDWAEATFRFMGIRSARQQTEIEQYFLNQKSLAIDGDKMTRVRAATRALIRSGNYDRLPDVFDDYLNAGGKPWNYGAWVRGMVKEAQKTRGENQLYKMMKSPGHDVLLNRLQMSVAPYTQQ